MKKHFFFMPLLLLVTVSSVLASWGVSSQMRHAPLTEKTNLSDRERLLRLEKQFDQLSHALKMAEVKQTQHMLSVLKQEVLHLRQTFAEDQLAEKQQYNKLSVRLNQQHEQMAKAAQVNTHPVSKSVDSQPLVVQSKPLAVTSKPLVPSSNKKKELVVISRKQKDPLAVADHSAVALKKSNAAAKALHQSKGDKVVVAFE